jgi:hypothetical protein
MAVGTSFVRTPVHEGKGPTEHEEEEEEDEYNEIGMSQLGGALLPTLFEEQVLQTTFCNIRNKLKDRN